jgi:class 3 adenylate cyclase/tetratricopeptide (TPR) repeat protein
MQTCPQCGRENPADARFCSDCGALLAVGTEPAREERKVVTVLFADLVGFTSRAEQMDPEDVRAVLEPFHSRLREELEQRGGTVEKFIGDAVMALFGAPTAHEDDPERAVRAALAIRDWIRQEGELQLRIGITTGEALVALGARPAEGEGMAAGDVVNTAARLQSAAPANGILVDETTRRATGRSISYAEHDPIEAKGKAEPIPVTEVVEARSRYGVDVERGGGAPLIGREKELDLLQSTLERARQEESPQLVTLVGVPGIGKSRLVAELFAAIDVVPELVYWRQGRCLPYGEGMTYWALSEMVKAQAGILETDTEEQAQQKLQEVVAELMENAPDADWVVAHLRPLIGLAEESLPGTDRQAESFAAWRRFFEALAEQNPLVLVFEDLHWADDSLLDFIDHLVDWATGVPLLVVCTARPELLARRAGWGGGKPNAATISLSPLSAEETTRLVHALLERAVLSANIQTTLIERAGGNPLYAEEFARMIELGNGDETEIRLPESVQGIIAARLDAVPLEEKLLLQDAAVVGKVFWLGAVERIGQLDRTEAEHVLHRLERKEFVRRERRSSVGDESQYLFRHLLVRDVAYSQIPRATRAEKHRVAAAWIESLGRPDDHAEMLAHHYLTALELDRSAGVETQELAERARLRLLEAGDRAYALSAFPAAMRSYSAALDLWPSDDPERPQLLLRLGRVAVRTESGAAADELEEARDGLLAAGDPEASAEAEELLSTHFWLLGERDRSFECLERAVALVQDRPTSVRKAHILATLSRYHMLAGDTEATIRLGREALSMMKELGGDEEGHAFVLNNIGSARVRAGDARGLDDLEESVAISEAINSAQSARGYGNLASLLTDLGQLSRRAEILEKGVAAAKRFGMADDRLWLGSEVLWEPYWDGRWDQASRGLDEQIDELEVKGFWMETPCRWLRGRIRLGRGDLTGALDDLERAIVRARLGKDPQLMWPVLSFGARVYASSDADRAIAFMNELLSEWKALAYAIPMASDWLGDLAIGLDALDLAEELVEAAAAAKSINPWLEAAGAYAAGDFAGAGDVYGRIGALPDEAYARLRAARALVEDGRRAEADLQLERSLAFFRRADATAYVREGEALLAASA